MEKTLAWPTAVKQVCVIARDLDKTIKHYHDIAGIGPWAIWTPELTNMKVRGAEAPYSMKLALAWTDDFMWEVIQPLSGPSIYQEFLDQRGEGMHHVLIETSNYAYEDLIQDTYRRGCAPIMEGKWGETEFAYLDTQDPLGLIIEVGRRTANFKARPEADYYYPEAPQAMPVTHI